MTDKADWAFRYAKERGIDPHRYRSLDGFVGAMESHFDQHIREIAQQEMRKRPVDYMATHSFDQRDLSCSKCKRTMREVHIEKVECGDDQ